MALLAGRDFLVPDDLKRVLVRGLGAPHRPVARVGARGPHRAQRDRRSRAHGRGPPQRLMPSARLFLACGLVTLALVGSVAAPWLAWVALAADLLLVAAFAARPLARGGGAARRPRGPGRRCSCRGRPSTVAVEVRSAAARTVDAGRCASRSTRRSSDAPLRERLHGGRARPRTAGATRSPAAGAASHTVPPLDRARARPVGPRLVAADAARPAGACASTRRCAGRARSAACWRSRIAASWGGRRCGSRASARSRTRCASTVPGDPPLRIHWKASARHDRLISREDTWERGARLLVLLDCARRHGRAGRRAQQARPRPGGGARAHAGGGEPRRPRDRHGLLRPRRAHRARARRQRARRASPIASCSTWRRAWSSPPTTWRRSRRTSRSRAVRSCSC